MAGTRDNNNMFRKMFIITSFVMLFSYMALLSTYGKNNNAEHDHMSQDELEEVLRKQIKEKHYEDHILTDNPSEPPPIQGANDSVMKTILLWTPRKCFGCAPFSAFKENKVMFNRGPCSHKNCFITDKKDYLGNYTEFDALLFNGRPILRMKAGEFPEKRSPHQTYVFVQLESADRFPVCDPKFDNFFNTTMTYRLTSDYQWPYIEVTLLNGTVIGPKKEMHWIHHVDMQPIGEELRENLRNKTKAAAWFVSNCGTRSNREGFVKKLQTELVKFNLTLDVFGKCGTNQCPRSEEASCNSLLEAEYFFYLSFENSFSEDYATEKLLTPLQHNTVPVVFGGANYSTMLPPGSYLNARELGAKNLAQQMLDSIENRTKYEDFFKWRNHYAYRDSWATAFCSLCVGLHEGKPKEMDKFREWWFPNFKKRC